MENADLQNLRVTQENVLHAVYMSSLPQVQSMKFLGGTALSRCYLQHRVSYDLDFFLPEAFDPRELLCALRQVGIAFQTKSIFDKETGCVQVHGSIKGINVSFIEDKLFRIFPTVRMPLRDACVFPELHVLTEAIDGLYHRKLICISGDRETAITGRQKARDVFDMYALGKEYKSLADFIPSLSYSFPTEQFIEAFASLRWHELLPEMGSLLPATRYKGLSLIEMEHSILEDLDSMVQALPDQDTEGTAC